MKILVIGGTGLLGRAIVEELSPRHEVVPVGHRSGDLRVEITDPSSIERLFATVGRVDAVVNVASEHHVGPLAIMSEHEMALGITSKLLGQLTVARLAIPAIADRGSITLTSGLASRIHRPGWTALAAANAGVEAFGQTAALELPRNIRINVVAPGMVLETLQQRGRPDVDIGTPAREVARVYARLVEGNASGTVVDIGRV